MPKQYPRITTAVRNETNTVVVTEDHEMTASWLDENPNHMPDKARMPLYVAIMLEHGEFQRNWVWKNELRSQIFEMACSFDLHARSLRKLAQPTRGPAYEVKYMDKLLTQYQVWCALNEPT